jgi:hypothetical protein
MAYAGVMGERFVISDKEDDLKESTLRSIGDLKDMPAIHKSEKE